MHCLAPDTIVLTPTGYKNITLLKEGDCLITSNLKKSKIISINEYTCYPSKQNNPYIIKKGQITVHYPPADIRLSGGHAIKYKDTWIIPKFYPKFRQDKYMRIIRYFHIELENYSTDNLIINNGAIVESYGDLSNELYLKERNKRTNINSSINKILI